mmetsp:Transcript_149327/g.371865  ORF Transcript_149327/g.371865 Transcript_149327/m.371865 type:complete len:202 (+) Transcript_149327:946-1551(+)
MNSLLVRQAYSSSLLRNTSSLFRILMTTSTPVALCLANMTCVPLRQEGITSPHRVYKAEKSEILRMLRREFRPHSTSHSVATWNGSTLLSVGANFLRPAKPEHPNCSFPAPALAAGSDAMSAPIRVLPVKLDSELGGRLPTTAVATEMAGSRNDESCGELPPAGSRSPVFPGSDQAAPVPITPWNLELDGDVGRLPAPPPS